MGRVLLRYPGKDFNMSFSSERASLQPVRFRYSFNPYRFVEPHILYLYVLAHVPFALSNGQTGRGATAQLRGKPLRRHKSEKIHTERR